jgi:hypothetical protein
MYRVNVVNSPNSQPLTLTTTQQHQQQQHPHHQQQLQTTHHVPLQLVSNTANLQNPLILSHLGSGVGISNNNNNLSTNNNINNNSGVGGSSSSSSSVNTNVISVIDVSTVNGSGVSCLAIDESMITTVKVEPMHDTIAGTSSNINGNLYNNKRPRMEG